MTANELRKKYLQFFKEHGHTILSSAPLLPENDPTVLFTTAGMHPLVPFLLGEEHPAGKRLASIQKCIRTCDIDEVGDDWHLTFFEMLGNWSLGDKSGGYNKEQAIKLSWEFLTAKNWLGLDKTKLAVTIFDGNKEISFDKEAKQFWLELGVPEARIVGLSDNWWGPAGKTGPCGPDTEIFYWSGEGEAPEKFDPGDNRWVEIWNNVFMQYNKTADGKYESLAQKNIDTGMGLERTLAVLNGNTTVYETDLLEPIIKKIRTLRGSSPLTEIFIDVGMTQKTIRDEVARIDKQSERIIADHLRAATFILGDEKGIAPSNIGQGYILRRLVRRAIRYARKINVKNIEGFIDELVKVIFTIHGNDYPVLEKNREKILDELRKEEKKFSETLDFGLKKMRKLVQEKIGTDVRVVPGLKESTLGLNIISGEEAFDLYQTYGFPSEMIEEELYNLGMQLKGYGFIYSKEEFEEEFKKHQELSRTASAGQFKGGLADDTDEVRKLHTATHLLHAALRQVLGNHVEQRGSNITAERLRFDFSHPQKMTLEEIQKVEDLVNGAIKKSTPIVCEIMSVDEAKKQGAMGLFENKYGVKVKVYSVGDFSKEICGGPHADNTGDLGQFKIVKEEASSAGIRRIRAILIK